MFLWRNRDDYIFKSVLLVIFLWMVYSTHQVSEI